MTVFTFSVQSVILASLFAVKKGCKNGVVVVLFISFMGNFG